MPWILPLLSVSQFRRNVTIGLFKCLYCRYPPAHYLVVKDQASQYLKQSYDGSVHPAVLSYANRCFLGIEMGDGRLIRPADIGLHRGY